MSNNKMSRFELLDRENAFSRKKSSQPTERVQQILGPIHRLTRNNTLLLIAQAQKETLFLSGSDC